MKHFITTGLLALVLELTVSLPQAAAQMPYQRPSTNPYNTPVFSPYLNLLRGGSNAAVNYYGLVRPEVQYNASLLQLQGQLQTVQSTVAGETYSGLPYTGHPVQFMSFSHYFPSKGVSGGVGARAGSSAAVQQPTNPAGGSGGSGRR
jgi:hypothetical protein